jgi:hypothetical protein
MNTTTHNEIPPANDAGVPPTPPQAHQKTVCERHKTLMIQRHGGRVLLSTIRESATNDFSLVFHDEELGVFIFERVTNDRVYLKAFTGRRGVEDFYYSFRTPEAARKYLEKFVDGVRSRAKTRAERKVRDIENRANHDVQAGDVFVAIWGYEQTNVDYYEVTRRIGDCMVEIRKIAAMTESTGWLTGNCVPRKGVYIGKPQRKRITVYNGVPYITINSFCTAHKTEPQIVGGIEVFKQESWTAYA